VIGIGITTARRAARPWITIAVHRVLREASTNTDRPSPRSSMARTARIARPPPHPRMSSPRMDRVLVLAPVLDTSVTPRPAVMAGIIHTWIVTIPQIIAPADQIAGKLCRVAPATTAPRTDRHVRKRTASTSTVHPIDLAQTSLPTDRPADRLTTTSIEMAQDLLVLQAPTRSPINSCPI